jgi:16S rRNA (uracil1498-N3)-methyltransferase
MSRFYVPKEFINGAKITVTGNEAHHIRDVMRLKVSDKVSCFDGTGKEYTGLIKEVDPKEVIIEITQTREPKEKDALSVTLIQAIPKKEKMDYIAEKATELGVRRIIPIMTDRTVVNWDDEKKARSIDRWNKISRAASKQCGRLDLPEIMPVTSFGEALKAVAGQDLAMIAALSGDTIPLKKALQGVKARNIVIAIGPEGDFTPQEIEEARSAGFKLVDLGRRVLKSDTAGLAVLAIINHELSN